MNARNLQCLSMSTQKYNVSDYEQKKVHDDITLLFMVMVIWSVLEIQT